MFIQFFLDSTMMRFDILPTSLGISFPILIIKFSYKISCELNDILGLLYAFVSLVLEFDDLLLGCSIIFLDFVQQFLFSLEFFLQFYLILIHWFDFFLLIVRFFEDSLEIRIENPQTRNWMKWLYVSQIIINLQHILQNIL